ncbi:SpoIIE family protein phosphatase [Kineococcus indalonis]|uniref:SpoIIE family protein phosphatase n=1 Tax=Kineococcus indalonis TaxID=2696566 RepID=UPI00141251EA|nr:SpoIIE family protein phosphatase [Kineococcus indalonis]NAZ88135.1 SpoIIE family protein phosphatase [Kineococcus indalonis]
MLDERCGGPVRDARDDARDAQGAGRLVDGRVLADLAPVMLWSTDATGACTSVNRRVLEFFGCTEDDMLSGRWRSILHPDDAPAYLREFEAATAGRRGFRATTRVRGADGSYRWIETTAEPLLDADGRFAGLAGSNPDVTDRLLRGRATAFAAELGDVFARADEPAEVTDRAGRRLVDHLGLALLVLAPADGPGGASRVAWEHGTGDGAGEEHVEAVQEGGRRLFTLTAAKRPGEAWHEEELRLLREVAPRLSLHLTRARAAQEVRRRYDEARAVVARLQAALLPAALPVLPGLDLAARYVVAGAGQGAGGDWFDAVVLDGGRVALVVGDVVGHGVLASATMSQLRAVLGQRLGAGAGLLEAVADVEQVARRLPGAAATTLCAAVLDPAAATLAYVTSGHPAPLVVRPDGTAAHLEQTAGGPLAVAGERAVRTARLGPGEHVLLYTDGLVERPGRSRAAERELLAGAAGRALRAALAGPGEAPPTGSPADALCRALVGELAGAGARDDVTVLVAGPRTPPGPLRADLPAEPRSLAELRAQLRDWAAPLHLHPAEARTVHLLAGEAVANAVEHAHDRERRVHVPAARRRVRVGADVDGSGVLRLVVADDGRWRPPREQPGDRGRGLALLGALGRLRVDATERGTVVSVERALQRPVEVDVPGPAEAAAAPGEQGHEPPFEVLPGGGAVLRVRGAVDLASAPDLLDELRRAARGGAVRLTVDLSGVTHLASAGVQALVEAARGAGGWERLDLLAPQGGAAAAVLDLAALPHRTS